MIVAVIGMVLFVLLIPAIWVGRGVVDDYVATLAANAHDPLQQAADATAQLRGGMGSMRDGVDQLGQQTDSAVQGGTIENRLADRLITLLDTSVGPAYVQLRESYVALRERLRAAQDAATAVRRLLPGLPLPSLPTDEVAALDTQLQGLDTSIRQMRTDLSSGTLPDNVPGVEALRRVSDTVRDLDARFDALVTRVDDLQARIAQAQVQVDAAQATLERATTIVAVVLTLLCLYLVGLHAALFAFGRTLRRPTIAQGGIVVQPQPLVTNPIAPAPAPAAAPAAATTSTPGAR